MDIQQLRGWWNLATRLTRRPPVAQTPSDVVHAENKWRLLRYRPRAGGPGLRTPVLLVPSLINRYYVLDLAPGRSMVEYLVAQGHDTFVLDWGTPGDEDRELGFDDFCDRYLARAIRVASGFSEREQVHLVGYCLGGTFAAIHAAVHPENIASITAVAAPIRFHDDGLLSRFARTRSFDAEALVEAFGNVPWPLMQATFQMLRPTATAAKIVSLWDRAANDDFIDGFAAVEAWSNDAVSFPGRCFVEYIEGLYRADGLVNRTFQLSGQPVHLDAIRCPTLAITVENDHIVPWQSAAELVERVGTPDRERIHLRGGHVGAVVSKAGAANLWPKLSAWWAARDEVVAASQQKPPSEPEPRPARKVRRKRRSGGAPHVENAIT
ncbi:MAG: alpha/beta fold hydrolase [Myxococcaceae bacterium]